MALKIGIPGVIKPINGVISPYENNDRDFESPPYSIGSIIQEHPQLTVVNMAINIVAS